MPIMNFGQPGDGVIQTAFIVEDIREAMSLFTKQLNVGPWFLRERGVFPWQVYKGQPTNVELAIAMGYSGSMQYELIQQLNDTPSVYMDVVRKRGYGLHHFGVGAPDYAARVQYYRDEGFELHYEAEVVNGNRVAYFDTMHVLPAMIEVIGMTPATEAMFTQYQQASVGWDGSNPVRLRAPLPPKG
jgi:hypothetical protein